jgi:hypothetical protein
VVVLSDDYAHTESKAYVSISNGCCSLGNESTGVEHKRCFISLNTFCWDKPHKFFSLPPPPSYLAEGPCNMGESQHKIAIEIGKA